jgi:hypothetical protein
MTTVTRFPSAGPSVGGAGVVGRPVLREDVLDSQTARDLAHFPLLSHYSRSKVWSFVHTGED